MSTLIAILFFGTVYALESTGKSKLFRPWIRGVLGDYAYPVDTPFPKSTKLRYTTDLH